MGTPCSIVSTPWPATSTLLKPWFSRPVPPITPVKSTGTSSPRFLNKSLGLDFYQWIQWGFLFDPQPVDSSLFSLPLLHPTELLPVAPEKRRCSTLHQICKGSSPSLLWAHNPRELHNVRVRTFCSPNAVQGFTSDWGRQSQLNLLLKKKVQWGVQDSAQSHSPPTPQLKPSHAKTPNEVELFNQCSTCFRNLLPFSTIIIFLFKFCLGILGGKGNCWQTYPCSRWYLESTPTLGVTPHQQNFQQPGSHRKKLVQVPFP